MGRILILDPVMIEGFGVVQVQFISHVMPVI